MVDCMVFLDWLFLIEMFNSWVIFGEIFGRKWVLHWSFLQHIIHGWTEAANQNLGNLLRFVGEYLTMWDNVFFVVEFAYNNLVNISIGLSSFEKVIGYKPWKSRELPILIGDRPSASVESFVNRLYNCIRWQIATISDNYKSAANLHK